MYLFVLGALALAACTCAATTVQGAVKGVRDEVKEVKKVVIVTDPGVDDSAAILVALASPEVEVLGIVANFGVCSVDCTTNNTLKLLHIAQQWNFLRQEVPVYTGAAFALGHVPDGGVVVDSMAMLYHGPHGLGTFTGARPAGAAAVEGVTGAEFLLDVVTRRLVGQVSVLVFSPPTSLAQALSMAPHAFTRSVKSVHLMGGAFKGPGNVTPLAESNFHQDPVAADAVIRAFQELGHGDKLVLAPLGVTLQVAFSQNELNSRLTHGAGQWWARDVCPYYIAMYSGIMAGMPMHDVHPLAQLLHPEWYMGVRPRGLRVETAAGGGGAALGMLYHDARHWSPRVAGGATSDSDSDSDSDSEVVVVAVEGGGNPVRGSTPPTLPLVLLEVDAESFKEWVLSLLSAI